MREAYFDSAWVTDQAGALLGIRLGYDHCAEHSGSAVAVHDVMEDIRTPGQKSGALFHFERFKQRSFDSAIRPFPVAILVIARRAADEAMQIKRLKAMTKVIDPGQGDPPRSFLMTAWGSDGFAIQARGQSGIEHLERLHNHIAKGEVSIAAEHHAERFGRSGLSLAITE